jgi:hypothetical protein
VDTTNWELESCLSRLTDAWMSSSLAWCSPSWGRRSGHWLGVHTGGGRTVAGIVDRRLASDGAGRRLERRAVDSTRLRGQFCSSGRSTLLVWEVGSTRLGGQLSSSGRSTQLVWEVDSTRLGGQLNPSGRSTLPVWEVSSTRLGGQLYSSGRSALPVWEAVACHHANNDNTPVAGPAPTRRPMLLILDLQMLQLHVQTVCCLLLLAVYSCTRALVGSKGTESAGCYWAVLVASCSHMGVARAFTPARSRRGGASANAGATRPPFHGGVPPRLPRHAGHQAPEDRRTRPAADAVAHGCPVRRQDDDAASPRRSLAAARRARRHDRGGRDRPPFERRAPHRIVVP